MRESDDNQDKARPHAEKNNAGFQEHADSLLDITEERFDETLKTNIYGYFHMSKALLPHLKRGASIVNTGSVTGLKGNDKLLDYSTSKGAIHAFTMALAANLLESQCGRTRPCVDSPRPGRQIRRRFSGVRQKYQLSSARPTRRIISRVCISCVLCLLELHHRNCIAGDGKRWRINFQQKGRANAAFPSDANTD
jgi:hypothetical protein